LSDAWPIPPGAFTAVGKASGEAAQCLDERPDLLFRGQRRGGQLVLLSIVEDVFEQLGIDSGELGK
jgi:hypothetical protein